MIDTITQKFIDTINALPALSDNLSDAVSKSAVLEVADKCLASIAETFNNLSNTATEQAAQLAAQAKEIELLSQANLQLLRERNRAAEELVNAGNRIVDLSSLSAKLTQARDKAEIFINSQLPELTKARDQAESFIKSKLPELFARTTQLTKVMGSFGLGLFVVGTVGHYLSDKDSTYLKNAFRFIQVAGLLAIGTAIGAHLNARNIRIQVANAI